MQSEAAYRLCVVCEGESDFRTVSHLLDHLLYHSIDWLTPDVIDQYRSWFGREKDGSASPYLKWASLKHLFRDGTLTRLVQGPFRDGPTNPDAAIARKLLWYLNAESKSEAISGVLLVRDSDGDIQGRASGLRQARDSSPVGWPFAVAVGVAHPCREGWLLCLYKPRNSREEQLLDEERRTLKFDPTNEPQRLLAKADGEPRNPKRVLSALTCDNHERESQCVEGWSVEEIKNLGQATLLSDFIREIEQHLIPLFAGHRP
jgi:hypothetical protein